MNECVFIYRTHHIMSHGGLQCYFEWDRTSACEGASGCRYQSVFDLTHPPSPCMKCEIIGVNLQWPIVNLLIDWLFHCFLSADSQQLRIANENRSPIDFDQLITKLVSHLSAHRAQSLKPLNCRCKQNKAFFPKRYFTFLCNETIVNLY